MPRRKTTVRTRGLGAELRDLRANTGLSTRAVAQQLGWSASTLNRMETGQRAITAEDVSALLVVYGVTGPDRDRLLDAARDSDRPGWWETTHAGLPEKLPALIGFESQATQITDVSLVLIPGLLQTPEYTRAVMQACGVPPVDAETLVATRLGRQAVLSRPDPPEYLAILDEAALRRPVGGRAAMAEQLRHVTQATERSNVTVQLIPFDRGAHTGLDGPFVVLDFTMAQTVVHLEHKRASLFVDEANNVAPFVSAVDTLRGMALDPRRSAEFIASVAAEYDRE
jgi:transcriptional regulator with XRE-family HTH domain